ncbi:MAG: hypothetical protein E7379_03925 [Clostridiales bacterium]|nr:hypothetical protein [Clostridiales bacterium]
MKFILSGGGLGEKTNSAYQLFANELKAQPVLFIPIADEYCKYEEDLTWFKKEVKSFNITNIKMITSAEELSPALLNSIGGIYFQGGNAFLLLHLLKSCQAFEILKNFINQEDKIIMGGSAGADIFAKDISVAEKDDLNIIASDENIVNLQDTKGFNVIDNFSLFVHYKVKERQYDVTEQKVQRLLNQGHKLICLPEETSIFIDNNKIKVLGTKPAELITKIERKIVNPNEFI